MSNARGFIGAGDVYIDRMDKSGKYTGYVNVGNTNKLEIKSNSDIKKLPSHGRDDYGQSIATVALPKPSDLSLTLNEVNKENMELVLGGTSKPINQPAGTMTDELVVVSLDRYIDLPFENLTATGLIATSADGVTTYVLDTDYTVNYRLGMFMAKSTGSILEGATVKLSGQYNAMTGSQIDGATRPQIRARIKLDGKNLADESPIVLEIYDAMLTPDGSFDFLKDDWAELPLSGSMSKPKDKDSPYSVKLAQ